jgi:hypothetical protein
MKKFLVVILGLLIFGCSPTPNDVTISVTPNICAPNTSKSQSPYCMMVTLQNNNRGENANNVQVTSAGITLNFTANTESGAVTYSGVLCDNKASGGVCPNATSQVGNILLQDPNNCATQQGANVKTLMAGGGICNFYLTIVQEAYRVGNYPTILTYNYTNANQNYLVATTFNQTVNVITGANNGLFILNRESWQEIKDTNTQFANVNNIIRDNYGYFYFNSDLAIYSYDGNKLVALNSVTNSINSLFQDNNFLLALVKESGIYSKNLNSNESWQKVTINGVGIENNFIGITKMQQVLYLSSRESIYSCNETIQNNQLSMNCTNKISGIFYPNTINANQYLYYASNKDLFKYDSISESTVNYTITPDVVSNYYISSFSLRSNDIVFGVNNLLNPKQIAESSVYFCTDSSICSVLLSKSLNHLNGNINSITRDGANSIYFVGESINSKDMGINYTNSGYLQKNTIYQNWQAIGGDITSPQVVITGSNLNNIMLP